MPNDNLRLAVIVSSVREGRFGPVVARWFATRAAAHDAFDIEVIDLADVPLPAAISQHPTAEVASVLADVSPRLAAADAFVVVTPEYNHSFPASLKTVIDWHLTEWQAKPVGFVSYGGLAGGLRAVEHLRQIFAELHAMSVRDTISFHNPWTDFDESGEHNDSTAADAAAKSMLDQINWWAEALREARIKRPYKI